MILIIHILIKISVSKASLAYQVFYPMNYGHR